MNNFEKISQALKYIENHLTENIPIDRLADKFYLSPFYFHRIFSAITGKAIAEYIRDRRLERACILLSETNKRIIDVGLDCGYESAQSFSRAFKNCYGVPPLEYRRQGYSPLVTTTDEMIIKFTNRLRGGVLVNPKIIKRNKLIIAGISGDGYKTGEVWEQFMELVNTVGIPDKLSDNGYEIRIYEENKCIVHVGYAVSGANIDDRIRNMTLPASYYAAFDVYPARGYESENTAIDKWLETNESGYSQRLSDGKSYAVEFYDGRFNGNEADSIVEIWIPIEKK